jgi:hypothetical protein
MPKANTPKNTKSNNSKTSKRKSSILKRFSLKSKKSRYIAVIVAMAAIGSFFTFRSFAATASQTWTYTRTGKNMSSSGISPCSATDYNDPAKGNAVVINMACPGNSTKGSAKAASIHGYLPVGYLGYYRACAVAKGSGYFNVQLSVGASKGVVANYPAGTLLSWAKLNSQSYGEYCTNYVPVGELTPIESSFNIANYPGLPSWINVSQVKIERR